MNFGDQDIEGSLYFTTQGEENASLWRTDGTQAGTEQVFDLAANDLTSGVENITIAGDRFFFTRAIPEAADALWRSDGTSDGTALVKDITIGNQSSSITDLTVVDGTLYFITNSEIWQSDGTENGTFKIQPLRVPNVFTVDEFSDVQELPEFDNQLYFSARIPSSPGGNSTQALLNLEDMNDAIGSPVYRLFNPELGTHLYTINESERDSLVDSGYQPEGELDRVSEQFGVPPEGVAFTAVTPTAEGSEEVYRFFNEATEGYLYTTNEAERDSIQENSSDFVFQGIAFNAYETSVEGSIPVYRFFEPSIGTHLYTSEEAERESIEANLPNYNFEGVAYYALPSDAGDGPLI